MRVERSQSGWSVGRPEAAGREGKGGARQWDGGARQPRGPGCVRDQREGSKIHGLLECPVRHAACAATSKRTTGIVHDVTLAAERNGTQGWVNDANFHSAAGGNDEGDGDGGLPAAAQEALQRRCVSPVGIQRVWAPSRTMALQYQYVTEQRAGACCTVASQSHRNCFWSPVSATALCLGAGCTHYPDGSDGQFQSP